MTEENEDARVLKSIKQLKQVRERLAKLRPEASDIAMEFTIAGKCLRETPERFWFEGETPDEEFLPKFPGADGVRFYNKTTFHAERLATLAAEIRSLISEERRLASDLRGMGYGGTIV